MSDVDRAVASYAAMQALMYVADGTSLYREACPWRGGNPYAYLWPFSRAWLGTLSLAGLVDRLPVGLDIQRDLADRQVGLARYWNAGADPPAYDSYVGPPLGHGGDRFFDDNVWLALALIERYQLGRNESVWRRARELFDFGRSGWDPYAAEPAPGGVFWVEQGRGLGRTNHDRGAGLTAGYAKLGFVLRELTGPSGPDPRPETLVDWVDASLAVDSTQPSSGLYWNLVRRDGTIDTNLWSYVQGEMIGARALQYRLTHADRALEQAVRIARATLATFGAFTRQPPSFNAMCFQNLLLLTSLADDAGLRDSILQTVQTYADWAWNPASGARDAATNLFHFASDGRPVPADQPAYLQDQGALVQIYALLAWDPANYAKLT